MRVSDRPISPSEIPPDLRPVEPARSRAAPGAPDALGGRKAADRYARTAAASETLRREELAAGPLGAVARAARLVTRVFGFRLGKFGLTYRTQDVAVDMEAVARDLAERARREARDRGRLFGEELDAARVLTLTDRFAPSETADMPEMPEMPEVVGASEAAEMRDAASAARSAARPQSWLLRLAFALYGRNAEPAPAGADQPARSRLLAVA